MKVVTGDENGLVKVVDVDRGSVAVTAGFVRRDLEVSAMCWADAHEAKVAVARKGGYVDVLNTADGAIVQHFDGMVDAFAGLHLAGGSLLSTNQSGLCTLLPVDGAANVPNDSFKINVDKNASILRMRGCASQPHLFATGGKEHELQLWDLNASERTKPIFLGKNVKNSMVDLRVPVHISDLAFLDNEGTKLVTCTALKHVRVYDTKASQRRPVMSLDFGTEALRTLCVTPDHHTVFVADTIGGLYGIDLRTGTQSASFKGVAGALQSLAVHPTANVLASVGLDRHLRVHNLATRKLEKKVYLKQRTMALLFSSEGPIAPSTAAKVDEDTRPADDDGDNGEEDEDDEQVDDETLWGALKTSSNSGTGSSKGSSQHKAQKGDKQKGDKRAQNKVAEEERGEDDEDVQVQKPQKKKSKKQA